MAHLLGCARESTAEHYLDLHLDALRAAGCYRVFADAASGALDDAQNWLRSLTNSGRPTP